MSDEPWRGVPSELTDVPLRPWREVQFTESLVGDVVADECPDEVPYPPTTMLVVGVPEDDLRIIYASRSQAVGEVARLVGSGDGHRFWRPEPLYVRSRDTFTQRYSRSLRARRIDGGYVDVSIDDVGAVTFHDAAALTLDASLALARLILETHDV